MPWNVRICDYKFSKALKVQKDIPGLLSYLGFMYCNYRLRRINEVISAQQQISSLEFNGSFWDRNKSELKDLGMAAVAAVCTIAGCPPGPAVAMASQTSRKLKDGDSEEFNTKREHFNQLRNAILSIKFNV